MTNFDLSVLFFLQIFVILMVCRVVGYLGTKFGQPQVVGEMIAGVVLGPSVFGLLAPQLQAQLFPKESRSLIYAVAQVGLVLYMFVIGMEFDVSLIRSRLKSAATVSLSGILAPFVLGAGLAFFLVQDTTFFTGKVDAWIAMLFMGAAMSITAFPMLARIIHERGLSGTPLGTLALAAGSMDDAVAWCVLAVVLASFKANLSIALLAIGGGALFLLFNVFVMRRVLKPLGEYVERRKEVSGGVMAGILALVALSAWLTDSLGIYAVFGAFIFGTSMPRGLLSRELMRKIEPLTVAVLLPLFFINSGLNTSIGLLSNPYLWLVTGLVLVAAVGGKFVACWLAARACGESQRISLSVGSLMNARGLMELIALNIGLDQKIITPTLFAVLVIMAIATTLMASPMFELVSRKTAKDPDVVVSGSHDSELALEKAA
ncbi:MAG: cation:proton antiporter [Chloroflexi bacterium]|nr:cation:proton antiporter [Chloroflexota bacterium]OJV92398.1 MAG: cation/H(+) antiporter [Chloroflexi bacterium 54-19]